MIKSTAFAVVAVIALTGVATSAFAQAAQSGPAAHHRTSSAARPAKVAKLAAHRGGRGAARLYDGAWSVVIQTTNGSCPAGVRASVRIVGGRLVADDQSYRLDGRVAPGGAVRVTVSAGGQGAGGSGRLSYNGGRGLWRTWSGECSGQWTAERRD
jgi:hypothetical protein